MALELNSWSRFRATESVLYDGKETFGRWNPPAVVQELPPQELITIRVDNSLEGRPDMIALAAYGTTQLDWVIIAYNKARGVLNWPRAGQIISFPSQRTVAVEL